MLSTTRDVTTVAMLSAAGIALFVIESYIPSPLPFLKIGLANISSVIALLLVGPLEMMTVVAVRIVIGSLLVGTFLSPSFVIALASGVVSSASMAMVHRFRPSLFSPIGLSLIGAILHVTTQVVVVSLLVVQASAVVSLVPFLLLTGVVGGLVVGWLSARLLRILSAARLHA
jgi:heptaprenyl diphosphate synthase